MINKIKNITKNPLFSGSLLMIVGSNFNNFINYIYHFVMGRLLGPENYGELVALLTLIGLISIIPQSFFPTIVRFISSAKNDSDISHLTEWFYKKAVVVSVVTTVILLIFSPLIASFVKINTAIPIILIAVTVVFSLQTQVIRAVLQGVLKFKQLIISTISESGIKLILGIVLVTAGFSLMGAVAGMVAGGVFTWWISKKFIKNYLQGKEIKVETQALLSYSLPMVIQTMAFTSLYSSDVILVKHYFSAYDAGIYASLSSLGKIVTYGANPIAGVMFPIIANRNAKGQKWLDIFYYSILMTLAIIIIILGIYKFFPDLAIKVLYGNSYLQGVYFLFSFGVFVAFLSLSSLFANFFFSLGKTVVSYFIFFAAILQIIGIVMMHSNITDIIYVSTVVCAILFFSLIIYFIYEERFVFSNSSRLPTREYNL